ncbi:MAG: VTT domain-containing protein [bacterium]|nr:TVP38/TMEM64 family protein [Gemmatimonadota bacterium]
MSAPWARRILRSKFLWTVVILVAAGLAANRWVELEGGPREAIRQWGVWGPLVAFVVQTITTMTPVGAVFLAVVNGALFGPQLGTGINLASGVVGGVMMYFVWRRGNHEFDIQQKMRRLPAWFHRHAGDNLWFLTALRLFPWAGGSLADLVAGSHQVPLRTQIASLIIGYAPGSLIYALIGAGLLRLG